MLKDYCIYNSKEFNSITAQLSVLDNYIIENHSKGIPNQYVDYITRQVNIDISNFYLGSTRYHSVPVLVLRDLIHGLIIDGNEYNSGLYQPIYDPRQNDSDETKVWITEVIDPESMKCTSRIHEKNIGPTLTQLRKDITKLINKLEALYEFLRYYLNLNFDLNYDDIYEIVYGVTEHTFNECFNLEIAKNFISGSSNLRSGGSIALTSGMRYDLYRSLKRQRSSEFPSSSEILLDIGRCFARLVKKNLLDEKTQRFINKNKSRIDCVFSVGISPKDLFDESFINYYNESHENRVSIEGAIYLYDLPKSNIYIPSSPVNKFMQRSYGDAQIFYIPKEWRQTCSDDIRELENLIIQYTDYKIKEENYLGEFFPGGYVTPYNWGYFLEGTVSTLNQLGKLNPEWEKIVRENSGEDSDEKKYTYLLELYELKEQLSK